MRKLIVIPARFASSRLPGKPLLRETGKFLVQHVYERAWQSKLADRVIVATDDDRIEQACKSFGAEVVRTREDHPSGTDRVAEVAENRNFQLILNLQGDEPLIDPAKLDLLFELLENDPNADMATLVTPLHSLESYKNPNVVKAVIDDRGRALYFSRSPIPHIRDNSAPTPEQLRGLVWQHVGLYAYRKDFLMRLANQPVHPIEQAEKLEQLRVLATGSSIAVGKVQNAGIGVDTFEDYRSFVEQYQQLGRRAA
jgi:3-deoxy-manno-octulosonate cytidylyltransferase (CMP-KDO synthetase)